MNLCNYYRVEDHGQYPVTKYDLETRPENIYFFSPYLSFGDYDNSCEIERSNVRVFLEEFANHPDIIHLKLPYSSEMIGIKYGCKDPEILEILEDLENYPVIDEQDALNLKIEMIGDAWESFGERDFRDKIEKFYSINELEYSDLLQLYNSLSDAQNKYIEIEAGGNVYFPDIDLPSYKQFKKLLKDIK